MSFYSAPQSDLINIRPGHPWDLGPEVINEAGFRIFQQHLGPDSLPRPVALGMDLHLVPIGVAYALHTNTVPFYPQYEHMRPVHIMPPPQGQGVIGAYMYPPLPEYLANFPDASSRGSSPTSTRSSSSGSSAYSCSQDCCCPPSEPPETQAIRSSTSTGLDSSHKRKYDEYLRGGGSSRDGIPDGWYKCSCCTSGWYYVDPSEEDDGFDNHHGIPSVEEEIGSEQDDMTDYESEDSSGSETHMKIEPDD